MQSASLTVLLLCALCIAMQKCAAGPAPVTVLQLVAVVAPTASKPYGGQVRIAEVYPTKTNFSLNPVYTLASEFFVYKNLAAMDPDSSTYTISTATVRKISMHEDTFPYTLQLNVRNQKVPANETFEENYAFFYDFDLKTPTDARAMVSVFYDDDSKRYQVMHVIGSKQTSLGEISGAAFPDDAYTFGVASFDSSTRNLWVVVSPQNTILISYNVDSRSTALFRSASDGPVQLLGIETVMGGQIVGIVQQSASSAPQIALVHTNPQSGTWQFKTVMTANGRVYGGSMATFLSPYNQQQKVAVMWCAASDNTDCLVSVHDVSTGAEEQVIELPDASSFTLLGRLRLMVSHYF